jgi:hypothetical protein
MTKMSVVCGLSLGYKDPDAVVNQVRQTRLSFEEFVTIYN